jgi:hypothetical protein
MKCLCLLFNFFRIPGGGSDAATVNGGVAGASNSIYTALTSGSPGTAFLGGDGGSGQISGYALGIAKGASGVNGGSGASGYAPAGESRLQYEKSERARIVDCS